jgi:hypothetical protein
MVPIEVALPQQLTCPQKTIGAYNVTVLLEGLQGITLRPFTRILGWQPEEVELFLVDVRKDLQNRKLHAMLD